MKRHLEPHENNFLLPGPCVSRNLPNYSAIRAIISLAFDPHSPECYSHDLAARLNSGQDTIKPDLRCAEVVRGPARRERRRGFQPPWYTVFVYKCRCGAEHTIRANSYIGTRAVEPVGGFICGRVLSQQEVTSV